MNLQKKLEKQSKYVDLELETQITVTDYTSWGQSELIEKLENSDRLARKIVEVLVDNPFLSGPAIEILEMARTLTGDKIKK